MSTALECAQASQKEVGDFRLARRPGRAPRRGRAPRSAARL